jgi:hypothetical protein
MPYPVLIESLCRTRDALERLIAELQRKAKLPGGLSVTDEAHLRRSRRALRRINKEYLPWARLEVVPQEQLSRISLWLIGIWSQLPLDD